MICTRCIYADHIPYIFFDSEGVCNYCRQTEQLEHEYPTGEAGWRILEQLVEKIKRDGHGKPYDVVVGISGGCDSSYMLHLSKKLGLRPLAAHFDNTWNSKIAVENIHRVLKKLGLPSKPSGFRWRKRGFNEGRKGQIPLLVSTKRSSQGMGQPRRIRS